VFCNSVLFVTLRDPLQNIGHSSENLIFLSFQVQICFWHTNWLVTCLTTPKLENHRFKCGVIKYIPKTQKTVLPEWKSKPVDTSVPCSMRSPRWIKVASGADEIMTALCCSSHSVFTCVQCYWFWREQAVHKRTEACKSERCYS